MAGLLETDKFRFPTAGVHEADERLRSALSARHRRDNRQSRHGKNGWWRLGKGQTGVRKNAEKANDAFTSDRFARACSRALSCRACGTMARCGRRRGLHSRACDRKFTAQG